MTSSRRRGHNEGSIYLRSDGRWHARLHLGYEGGRRIRKSYYGATRREVQEKLTAGMRNLQLGTPPLADERESLSRFLDRWLVDTVEPSVRPSTYRSYEMLVRLHVQPSIGRVPLSKVSPQHVQRMLNEARAGGLSARSVHHVRAVLRRALNQAVRWGLVARNAAALVDSPRVTRYEIRAVGPEDARGILEAVRGDRLEALVTVALAVGLRQGEALGLRWQDLDLEAGQLTVRHALQRIDGALTLVEPKTVQSRRTIPLPTVAVASLKAHRLRQLEDRMAAGTRWSDRNLVFSSSVGTALDGVNVTRRMQRLLLEAGLPRMRFHDLRHACASLLLVQGVHPRVVMETLGHSQISLTMNTYSHVVPSLQRDAADRMELLLRLDEAVR